MALINKLEAIGDAIRAKTGKSDLLTLDQMPTEIRSIETGGGGGGDLPAEALIFKDTCNYKFAGVSWNWLIKKYGNSISTNDITSVMYMFYSNDLLQEIPFDININQICNDFRYIFCGAGNLKNVPRIYGNITMSSDLYKANLSNMFENCYNLRTIPDDYFKTFGGDEYWAWNQNLSGDRRSFISNCYSLRKLPDISMLASKASATNSLYYTLGLYCHALDEIIDLPVAKDASFTLNAFTNAFNNCSRLKDLTFKTNEDGSPIVATSWKKCTINLAEYIGYAPYYYRSNILNYNSGITADKEVKDDATYQALKNDPDWFTCDVAYSRYNYESAVRTINSLPDVSSGSANTIKFTGAAGAKTDGGAINTLTEAEIAVATAKGWTVSLV